ncbi:hypothetical protein [Streptomyces sp. DSM 40750]|uniref:hypothetical protein n=1 Tax=Streptomyces sp. DSM 40750 TaxID=2801030 RepID=UPI00214AEA54|nr:hypothetical protein [Streptomyces sp. DSM 40750]UUU21794.1 hypothetical protein JIX55_16460 [Streptomyces sp. DSM 40750]
MINSMPWRVALAATAATVVAAVPLATAQSAYAGASTNVYQPYPPQLSTATVPAGGVIYFVAEGFDAGETVTAALVPQSATTLSGTTRGGGGGDKCDNQDATYEANERGTVFGCFQVPRGTPPGPYLFTLTGAQSGSVSAPITVTSKNGHGKGEGKPHEGDRANTDVTGGAALNQAGTTLPLNGGIEGQPGTVKVSGNGKTLVLRTEAAEEQSGSSGTTPTTDLALAGYDGTGQDVSGGTGPAKTGSGTNWALVGGAAGLAAIATRTVTVVRRRRTRTEEG